MIYKSQYNIKLYNKLYVKGIYKTSSPQTTHLSVFQKLSLFSSLNSDRFRFRPTTLVLPATASVRPCPKSLIFLQFVQICGFWLGYFKKTEVDLGFQIQIEEQILSGRGSFPSWPCRGDFWIVWSQVSVSPSSAQKGLLHLG